MNYLAHIYLSGDNEQVILGNFIGDWIKGSDFKKYPADIQKGMILHRTIDSFTDSHQIVRTSKNRLIFEYHKYAGIIIDIFYDHFLAKNWQLYSSIPLPEFSELVNKILVTQMHFLPQNMQDFVPVFMNNRWLELYASVNGIEQVLQSMVRNTTLPDRTLYAMDNLEKYYDDFGNEFYQYFPQLVHHIEETYNISVKM
jgi:acyl carrier protein phosphodiesterase